MRRTLILIPVLAAFALGSCGVRGKLKTPPPLFGDKDRAPAEKVDTEANTIDDDGFIDLDADISDANENP